jgi:transposase
MVEKLTELGINGVMRAAILGNVIGRMAQPASERATWDWLQHQSALGELLDVDFAGLSSMRLYRASDILMKHRETIEKHIFCSVKTLFNLEETVTLYDLTNTYFEADAAANPKAKHGRSKEKRSDCPLVTLGLVLDGSGFVRRSKTFAGNVSEESTLETMLTCLGALPGARVIMDAGIATEANLVWLVEHGYRYLVVQRGGARQFEINNAVAITTAGDETVQLQKVVSDDGKEVRLYCHSEGREAKETAMIERSSTAFEAGLQKMADGLETPRTEKRHDKLLERLGRLKEKSRGASQHYKVHFVADESGKVTAISWEKTPVSGTMATHPGVYCLRSNELDWTEEEMWRTYTLLTDLESVFRSLKSELGLRPVFHQKENRSDGHLFITVLAYQCVQVLRTQLKKAGVQGSWSRLRSILSVQRRVTTSLRRKDGRSIHIRKSTVAEPSLMEIYQALKINPAPGGTKKMVV